VARYVMALLMGKGRPISRRNIRYSFAAKMYHMVLVVGVKDVPLSANTLFFDYTPYRVYDKVASGEGKMSLAEYQRMEAHRIATEIRQSVTFF